MTLPAIPELPRSKCEVCGGSGIVRVAHGEVIEDYDWWEAFMRENDDDELVRKVVYGRWETRYCPHCRPEAATLPIRPSRLRADA